MSVKRSSDIPKDPVTAGEGVSRQVLIDSRTAPNFAMRRFRIEVGGYMPLHCNTVEHEQYVLAGRAEVRIGGETVQVTKGDVVFIPAGVPHNYKTLGEEAFEFLCMVPNGEDKITLLES